MRAAYGALCATLLALCAGTLAYHDLSSMKPADVSFISSTGQRSRFSYWNRFPMLRTEISLQLEKSGPPLLINTAYCT